MLVDFLCRGLCGITVRGSFVIVFDYFIIIIDYDHLVNTFDDIFFKNNYFVINIDFSQILCIINPCFKEGVFICQ